MPRLTSFMNSLLYLRRRLMSLFIDTTINDKYTVYRGADEPWISRQSLTRGSKEKTFDFDKF